MKRAFEVKQKIFFFVSQVASFRLTKQTSKNVADTTFEAIQIKTKGFLIIFCQKTPS